MNHTSGPPLGFRVSQTPLSPPPLVFKLCAFDHLLGLKIFYAKGFQAPEFKDRGADTFLASGTLSSSCSAPLQFRLGQRQGWQLCPFSLGIQNP